ncbi:nucleophosmin 1a [Megalops cyprinoides]|uniref:nucleophosmin 1a n=1 Tax=Megalops cyprinoides TaxID=118141 RepID=UPI0018653509|nr:nucleophosmin 1a [Megalops cyprinoides]
MNGMDMEPIGPQNYLYGCELKAGKDVIFNPSDDDSEHQLSLRMVCVDPSTKDELHVVELEGRDTEGEPVKAVVATLKPSTLPSVCLGGFEITPPAVFRLKSGSGPIHISGQHLVMMDTDQSFDEEDDEEEEEEKEVPSSIKRPAVPAAAKPSKKMKMEEEDEEEDDEDDEDDDDDEEDDDEEESEEEESPVKPKKTPSKSPAAAQNGKTPNTATPAGKQNAKPKTPNTNSKADKKETPKKPQTPKASLTIDEMKAKMMSSIEKGVMLPKLQAKFENYVKNGLRVSDPKTIEELWKWRQTVKDRK